MNLPQRSFSKPLFILFAACSLIAVLWIPYFVPQSPSTSPSWLFGYNNRAGVSIVLICIGLGAVWTKGMGLQLPQPGPAKPLSKKLLLIVLAIEIVAFIAVYRSSGIYGGFGESNYEINRLYLLAQGKLPYIDFEYAYGAFLLYAPLALYRAGHFGIATAYYVFFFLAFLAGFVLVFQIVSSSNYPTAAKRSIFLVVCIPGSFALLSMGTNYSFFRFALPLYLIGICQRSLFRNSTSSSFQPLFIAVLSAAALLLISPETAIAFAFASVLLFAASIFSSKNWHPLQFVPTAGLCLSLAVIFALAGRLHVLDTTKSAGSNANSFPIVISPSIVLYFVSLFLCACIVFARWSTRSLSDSNLGLILVSIPLVAAALGRCDPAHIFWNGLGAFIPCMFFFSSDKRRYSRYLAAFLICIVILPAITGYPLGKGIRDRSERLRKAGMPAASPSDAISLESLYPAWHGGFLAPFGFTPNGLGTTLSKRIDYGPYDGTVNNGTPDSIARTLAEIDHNPDRAILINSGFEGSCQTNPVGQRVVISLLFDTIYFHRAEHPDSIRKPLCDFIFANYALVQPPDEQHYNYGLWVRRSPQPMAGTEHKN